MPGPPFRMQIADVFWLPGRPHPLVRGERYDGDVRVDDVLALVDEDGGARPVTVRTVELVCSPGSAPSVIDALTLGIGDGLARGDLRKGQVLRAD